jgi:hypothetical protein
MLDLGGCSVMVDQSKGKEGKLFGYSVLDTVKLRNDLVPDPERLPEITKKHFTEKMADFRLALGQRAREVIWIVNTVNF